jgi:nitrate reductase delta subunit
MYHVMAIANYEDRFVIPTGHREDAEDMYEERGGCGFSFGNGCSGGTSGANLFGAPAARNSRPPRRYSDAPRPFVSSRRCCAIPTRRCSNAAPVTGALLAEDGLLSPDQRAALQPLIDDWPPICSMQPGSYVALFDRGRALSLHLFEHVHGESRDRGQAMVDLRDRYEAQGLEIAAKELPDYLPLFLEYLSVLPPAQAAEELAQPGVIISALAQRLEEKATPYAAPMRILADLAGAGGEAFEIAPADDPDDLAALDAAWEEEQVRFDSPAAPGAPNARRLPRWSNRILNPGTCQEPDPWLISPPPAVRDLSLHRAGRPRGRLGDPL